MNSSYLSDSSIYFSRFSLESLMMKQSSKLFPTSARGNIHTCLLIQIAMSCVTLRTAPEVPCLKELVACHHFPTDEPNLNVDFNC